MIWVPRDLRRQVVASANANDRSISAEFRHAMRKHLEQEAKANGKDT